MHEHDDIPSGRVLQDHFPDDASPLPQHARALLIPARDHREREGGEKEREREEGKKGKGDKETSVTFCSPCAPFLPSPHHPNTITNNKSTSISIAQQKHKTYHLLPPPIPPLLILIEGGGERKTCSFVQ
jgi:hypothetical protein